MKKCIIIILVLVVLAAVFTGLKLFIIGEPADSNNLAVRVDEGDGQIAIYVLSTDSAMAISNLQYRYDGSTMHITVWKVLSSPFNCDGDICLYYEIIDETEVWLNGKLIWSKQ